MKNMRIFSRQLQTKEGRIFYTYSFTKDGKKFYKVKFTTKCKDVPTEQGYFLLQVEDHSISIEKAKKIDKYPTDVIWINELKSYIKDEEFEKVLREKRVQEIAELLD